MQKTLKNNTIKYQQILTQTWHSKSLKCKNSQEFIFDEDNTIRLKDNTNLCLTVAKEESRKGGGGLPVHLMRNLSMQKCNKDNSIYQNWIIRHFKKGKIFKKQISKF